MEKARNKQTFFDTLVTNRQLQLIKTVLPYIGIKNSSMLAIYTKAMELQNTINISNSSNIDLNNINFYSMDSSNIYNAQSQDNDSDSDSGQSSAFSDTTKRFDMKSLLEDIKDFLSDDEQEMIDMLMTVMELSNSEGGGMGGM